MSPEYIWPFWLGGLMIAFISIALVVTTGKFLAVTRGYVSACAVFSRLKYFQKRNVGGLFSYSNLFTVGLIVGGFIATINTVGYHPTWDLGEFNAIWGDSLLVKGVVLTLGGFLWGLGSRLAKGCTSGNAISGLSKGSVGSLAATCGFLIAGVVVTFAISIISGVK
ncbi:MAG TPA: YeeE/YedE thiosulfate transporter family protein [Turneriella sp.]|nr:YeeE/YedE thiosulfate transporter family protein [Turneriella sp.]